MDVEEEEITMQRDAAVSLCTALQEKVQAQAAEYDRRIEAAEAARIRAELEVKRKRQYRETDSVALRRRMRAVTQCWLVGTIVGWLGGYAVACASSPLLGFLLVLPCVMFGVLCGLAYSMLREKMEHLNGKQDVVDWDKEEFLRQLQGLPDTGGRPRGHGSEHRQDLGSMALKVSAGAMGVVAGGVRHVSELSCGLGRLAAGKLLGWGGR